MGQIHKGLTSRLRLHEIGEGTQKLLATQHRLKIKKLTAKHEEVIKSALHLSKYI